MKKRVDLRAILADPVLRRELAIETIIATQAREGVATTREQAERAHDAVQAERVVDQRGRGRRTAGDKTPGLVGTRWRRVVDGLEGTVRSQRRVHGGVSTMIDYDNGDRDSYLFFERYHERV